jgi:hypothetical protein
MWPFLTLYLAPALWQAISKEVVVAVRICKGVGFRVRVLEVRGWQCRVMGMEQRR